MSYEAKPKVALTPAGGSWTAGAGVRVVDACRAVRTRHAGSAGAGGLDRREPRGEHVGA
jgi:hypothetical protein